MSIHGYWEDIHEDIQECQVCENCGEDEEVGEENSDDCHNCGYVYEGGNCHLCKNFYCGKCIERKSDHEKQICIKCSEIYAHCSSCDSVEEKSKLTEHLCFACNEK